MWKWRESRDKEWKYYSDIENEIIEDQYKDNPKSIHLNENVTLDLKNNCQTVRRNKDTKSIEIQRINQDESN